MQISSASARSGIHFSTWTALLAASLSGCGGGSGESSTPSTPATIAVSVTKNEGGTVSPSALDVPAGQTASFTLTPDSWYAIGSVNTGITTMFGGTTNTCNGSLNGNIYTTSAITAPCTVNAYFTNTPGPGPLTTTRISVTSDGMQADDESMEPAISNDGRYVVFTSLATNLVTGDTNGYADVFVRDRLLDITTRVSVASDGTQGNGYSVRPAISGDGRYVSFYSIATNLVSGDTNGEPDVFLHDRETGITQRISIASDGSQANGQSIEPSLSVDGRYISFSSLATNFVPNDTNNNWDIFVHDRVTQTTSRVSVTSTGAEANSSGEGSMHSSISADGRYVAFDSGADNLAPTKNTGAIGAYVHDRLTGTTSCVSLTPAAWLSPCSGESPAISGDGRYIAYQTQYFDALPGDPTVLQRNIFVYDQTSAAITRVSLSWENKAVFGESVRPSISSDGNFIAFPSDAGGLVNGDRNAATDVFVRDWVNGTIGRASLPSGRGEAIGLSSYSGAGYYERPAIAGDGRHVAFNSRASNIVPGDTNQVTDIFVAEW